MRIQELKQAARASRLLRRKLRNVNRKFAARLHEQHSHLAGRVNEATELAGDRFNLWAKESRRLDRTLRILWVSLPLAFALGFLVGK